MSNEIPYFFIPDLKPEEVEAKYQEMARKYGCAILEPEKSQVGYTPRTFLSKSPRQSIYLFLCVQPYSVGAQCAPYAWRISASRSVGII